MMPKRHLSPFIIFTVLAGALLLGCNRTHITKEDVPPTSRIHEQGYASLVEDAGAPDPKAQAEMCKEDQSDACLRHCSSWPASNACLLYWRFGARGVEIASHLISEEGDLLARATEMGMSEKEADLLVLFLTFEDLVVDGRYTRKDVDPIVRAEYLERARACGETREKDFRSKAAIDCSEEIFKVAGRLFGKHSVEELGAIISIASLASELGHEQMSKKMLSFARASLETGYPEHHPLHILVDKMEGYSLAKSYTPEEHERGLAMMRSALERGELLWGANHPNMANWLESYGVVNLRSNSRVARDALERSFAIRLRSFGPKSREVGRSALFVGEALYQLGDYGSAFAAFSFAIEIFKDDKPRTYELAFGLEGMARTMFKRGEAEVSEQLMLEALKIFVELEDQRASANALNYLARVHLVKRDFKGALELFEKSRAFFVQLDGEKSLRVNEIDFNIATTLFFMGDFERARDGLIASIEAKEKMGLDVRESRSLLSNVYLALGDTKRARQEAMPSLEAAREEFLGRLLTANNELQVLELLSMMNVASESVYSLLEKTPEDDQFAAQIILDWSGASQWAEYVRREAMAVRQKLPETQRREFDKYLSARVAVTDLERAGDAKKAEEARAALLREHKLLLATPELRDFSLQLPPTVAEVCERVERSGRALVIYNLVARSFHDEGAPQNISVERVYEAVVFAPGKCAPARIRLGEVSDIEAKIDAWRRGVEKSEACYQKRGNASKCLKAFAPQHAASAELYKMLWAPVQKVVKTSSVWVTTEGRLDEVAFDTLVDEKDAHLIEKHELRLLPYPGAIAHLEASEKSSEGALILGDIDYDRVAQGSALTNSWQTCGAGGCRGIGDFVPPERVAMRGEAACGYDVSWGSLGATEARPVASHLGGVLGEETLLITGDGAQEDRVRYAMSGKRVLHLATHGFFASDASCESFAMQGTEAFNLGAGMASKRVDPLKLSAVVLSGANKEKNGADGILTGREVANIDLEGTELVVLSACETGRGKIHKAGGAQGLGQAFMMAGARNTIVSLWRVPSVPTRDLFLEFYQRAYGDAPQHPQVALRQAKLEMLKRARAEGVIYSAFLWGAFTAQSLQTD